MIVPPAALKPWQQSCLLTPTRTTGQVAMRRNGTALDIWLRVDGQPRWFAVDMDEVVMFLNSGASAAVFAAQSDGNAEPAPPAG